MINAIYVDGLFVHSCDWGYIETGPTGTAKAQCAVSKDGLHWIYLYDPTKDVGSIINYKVGLRDPVVIKIAPSLWAFFSHNESPDASEAVFLYDGNDEGILQRVNLLPLINQALTDKWGYGPDFLTDEGWFSFFILSHSFNDGRLCMHAWVSDDTYDFFLACETSDLFTSFDVNNFYITDLNGNATPPGGLDPNHIDNFYPCCVESGSDDFNSAFASLKLGRGFTYFYPLYNPDFTPNVYHAIIKTPHINPPIFFDAINDNVLGIVDTSDIYSVRKLNVETEYGNGDPLFRYWAAEFFFIGSTKTFGEDVIRSYGTSGYIYKPELNRVVIPGSPGKLTSSYHCVDKTVYVRDYVPGDRTYLPVERVTQTDPLTGETNTFYIPVMPPNVSGVRYDNTGYYTQGSATEVTRRITYRDCTFSSTYVPPVRTVYAPITTNTYDAGAITNEGIGAVGAIQFEMPINPKGVAVGLSVIDRNQRPETLLFGFEFIVNRYKIWEAGVVKSQGFYTPGKQAAIARSGNDIFYVMEDLFGVPTVIYQTTTSVTQTMFLDVCFYGVNDRLRCPSVYDSGLAPTSTESSATIADGGFFSAIAVVPIYEELVSANAQSTFNVVSQLEHHVELNANSSLRVGTQHNTGSDLSVTYVVGARVLGAASMSTQASLRAAESATFVTTLPALEGYSYNHAFGHADTLLLALTGDSRAGFSNPALVGSEVWMSPLLGVSTMLTGGIDIDSYTSKLPALDSLSSNFVYSEGVSSLPALTVFSGAAYPFDGIVDAEHPAFEVTAFVLEQPTNGLNTHISFEFDGQFGGSADIEFQMDLTASATVPGIARVDASFGFETIASVASGGIATAELTMHVTPRLTAYSGNGAALEFAFSVASEVITGGIAEVIVDFGFSMDAEVTAENYGRAAIVVPEFVPLSGIMYAVAPQFTMRIEGGEVVVRPTTTYVTHLSADAEMTEYTGYEFDCIVYFMDKYYGVRSDGMYLLEGTSDNGTNIDVNLLTQHFDFDRSNKKRLPYLYAGSETDFTVSPIVDDASFGSYTSTKGNERVYLPQGATGRYWQFGFQNIDGNKLALDNVEVIINELRRKV